MGEIENLQQRLSTAMERVARALEAAPPVPAVDVEALQTALEDEKTANAQLKERVQRLNEKQASEAAATHENKAQMAALDSELQRLRSANEALRSANAKLREANAAGVGEPHLINTAMMAELEALRAARAADVAEADAILSALQPLLAAEKAEG